MFLGFAFIICGLALLMILERIFPDRKLAYIPNWWVRVIVINLSQLMIVVIGAYTWEKFFQGTPTILSLKDIDFITPALGGFIAYLVNSYIFYWFHRARHEIYLFWILFHQVHHSPERIEAITSFYKHPLEILIDSILMTILLYPILGLTRESSIWLSIFSAYGEFFYHMNIKTPRFIGYFFQRPESHRIHHMRNKRTNCKNYSDFPLWDILGNTFINPDKDTVDTGYSGGKEMCFTEMLLFEDVLKDEKKEKPSIGLNVTNFLSLCLLIIGLLQPIGYLFNQPNIRGLGAITVASPLPLVFSAYNGVETFRTSFEIDLYHMDKDNQTNMVSIPLTKEIYSKIQGPYNRRNVFGVLFSHGPFFQQPNIIELRDHLLKYVICDNKLNLHIKPDKSDVLMESHIKVISRRNNQTWDMQIKCHN